MDKLLLTPVEAAQAVGSGRAMRYELLQAGELRSLHIGPCGRVPTEAFEAFPGVIAVCGCRQLAARPERASRVAGKKCEEVPMARRVTGEGSIRRDPATLRRRVLLDVGVDPTGRRCHRNSPDGPGSRSR